MLCRDLWLTAPASREACPIPFSWPGPFGQTIRACSAPKSPLMYAIECGWALDQIKVLVQAGCSVDVRRRTNSCFLLSRGGGLHHHCTPKVCKDRTECLKPTFFWRPKQTLDGSMCQTALHVAISKRKPEILEFLLGECGANRGSLQWPGEEPIPGNCVVPLGEVLQNHGVNISRWFSLNGPRITILQQEH
ncbi:hypothetical protein VTJ49DRAFT_2299 [Mycothermus thermophilus]|uniref:Uncharacterized protein n=1 Tax=Humicola insolens TaxID=85995 RepID=A0ABR3VQR3_HUMIN